MSKEKRKALIAVEYVGGYDERRKSSGMLSVYESYIKYSPMLQKGIELQLDDVNKLAVEAPDEVGKRVTATRLVTLGVLSLFLKKKTKESFIVLELKDGREVIFHVNGMTQMDVRSKLSGVL